MASLDGICSCGRLSSEEQDVHRNKAKQIEQINNRFMAEFLHKTYKYTKGLKPMLGNRKSATINRKSLCIFAH
jgi:hypothetical protein